MRFHHHPASYNSRRALAVAYHLGVDVEIAICDLMSGGQRAPAYLALNPNGKVPALEDGALTLWESMAISQYLADQRPSAFFPSDARARADITRWMAWDLGALGRATDTLLFENVLRGAFGLGAPDAASVASANQKFRGHATILEAQLSRGAYLTGDTLTVADLFVAGSWETAAAAGAPAADFPQAQRWHAAIAALPAWSRAAGR
jgi:glutathione S-transferase